MKPTPRIVLLTALGCTLLAACPARDSEPQGLAPVASDGPSARGTATEGAHGGASPEESVRVPRREAPALPDIPLRGDRTEEERALAEAPDDAFPSIPEGLFTDAVSDETVGRLELIHRGEAPHAPLRYTFSDAQALEIRLELRARVDSEEWEMWRPRPHKEARIRWTPAHDPTSDRLGVDLRALSITARSTPGVSPWEVNGLNDLFRDLPNVAVRALFGSIGEVQAIEALSDQPLDLPELPSLEPQVGVPDEGDEREDDSPDLEALALRRSVVDTLLRTMREVMVMVPPEPMGLGARWRQTEATTYQGVDVILVTEYELVERSEGQARVRYTQRFAARAQDISGTDLVGWARDSFLHHFDGRARGTIELDTRRIVARRHHHELTRFVVEEELEEGAGKEFLANLIYLDLTYDIVSD